MSEKTAFTRIGSAQVIAKIEDVFTVQITLSGSPDSMWIDCYRHPTDYIDNESHPSRTIVRGNKIAFFSVESEMEKNVKAMDKYLEHANDCYKRKLIQVSDFENKEAAKKKITQKELDRVKKNIKKI